MSGWQPTRQGSGLAAAPTRCLLFLKLVQKPTLIPLDPLGVTAMPRRSSYFHLAHVRHGTALHSWYSREQSRESHRLVFPLVRQE